MRTPEGQEHYLAHGRFGEGWTGKPIKSGCLSIVAAIAAWIGILRLGHYWTSTVAWG